MRILANENFPGPVVHALRESGADIAWIKEDQPVATDVDVLARAQAEHRLLATFDKGFGELAWKSGLPADCGVILFRLRRRTTHALSRHSRAGPTGQVISRWSRTTAFACVHCRGLGRQRRGQPGGL